MTAAESERKVFVVVGVSFGLLCILQAALNISLRLAKGSNSTASDIEAMVMLKMKLIDCDNKTLDIEARFKTLTEEMNELKKKLIVYDYSQRGWVHFNFSGSVYYISSEKKSWQQSRDDCLQKGADLMIINSKEEQNFTRQWKDCMWIGMTDSETEGQWKWVDGTPLNTSYWISGEPNSYELKEEDCGEVRYHEKENNWNDKPCHYQNFWICEKKVAL